MLFEGPSATRDFFLKLLEARILLRDIAVRIQRRVKAHSTAILSGAITGMVAIVGVNYRHPISSALSASGTAVLNFTNGHPRVLRLIHILLDSIPDTTVFLLAVAGLVYLMPDVVKKIEDSKVLRRGVVCAVLVFCIFSVVVNAINREEQERRDDEHIRVERNSSDRLYSVQSSLSSVQTFLVSSKGSTSEFDRRRGVLESLRAEYVLRHKDAPVSMMTGDIYPPAEWMNMRLKQLGENFSFVPPAKPPAPQQALAQSPPPPPADAEIAIASGNDDVETIAYRYNGKVTEDSWLQIERACVPPLKCYPRRDLDSQEVEIKPGKKGWARLFVTIYDTGASPIKSPYVGIHLAKGHFVAINHVNDHHKLESETPPILEFKPPAFISEIAPFRISHSGFDYPFDVVVDPAVSTFILGIRFYGDNLEAKELFVKVRVLD